MNLNVTLYKEILKDNNSDNENYSFYTLTMTLVENKVDILNIHFRISDKKLQRL